MFSDHRDRSRPGAAITAAGIDHVRLWYYYLDIGDPDACGSLLDENAQVSRPDAPPGHGREQVVARYAELARSTAAHHIYKIIADADAVAVMGRYKHVPEPGRAAPHTDTEIATEPGSKTETETGCDSEVEFADFFTLTDKGLLLSCRRYYFTAPDLNPTP